ncbi:MarR family winged helix-turn-helix transcriptional regulator [Maritalea mediterranea]|uniref:MarR family winged helix-turn-helix transcriptional regulator n=1 Tax=Maritalea mediterranea TaxID=2909667 RepID=A0ABS9ECV3_9HYPH|nr:MarR family winged helix-turn-helix transcriptional regulator [Maritalea mediterranea]MCF4099570.1 MarR family winged helix-turn-helix transcriptional regulator [Maritalea mediterranea]
MALKFEKTLSYQLMQLGAIARQESLAPLRDKGLQIGDDAVLFWLADRSRVTLEEMREGLNLPPEQFNALIDRLDGTQMLESQTDEIDGTIHLFLSVTGLELLSQIHSRLKALDKDFTAELSDHKAKKLKKLLAKINDLF